MSTDLYDDGPRIHELQASAAGIDIFYSSQRLESLIYQIQTAEEQPDFLLVAGDLTLNGEYDSSVDLKGYFEKN